MDHNTGGLDQMIEGLRDDIRQMRDETRALSQEGREASGKFASEIRTEVAALRVETSSKIDKLTDLLTKHVQDDSHNFQDLNVQMSRIQTGGAIADKFKERSWGHFSGWAAMIISFATMAVMYFHK
jgi:hypothetical protein